MTSAPTQSAPPTKSRGNLVADFIAGLTTGVANIPDAMASSILAGVDPVQGALCRHGGHAAGRVPGQLGLYERRHD